MKFLSVAILAALFVPPSEGYQQYVPFFPNANYLPTYTSTTSVCRYPGHANCASRSGGGDSFGRLISQYASQRVNGWATTCRVDSDGDGLTNGDELGDPCCRWPTDSAYMYGRTTDLSNPGSSQSKIKHASCLFALPLAMPAPSFVPSQTGGTVEWATVPVADSCVCSYSVAYREQANANLAWTTLKAISSSVYFSPIATLAELKSGVKYEVRITPTNLKGQGPTVTSTFTTSAPPTPVPLPSPSPTPPPSLTPPYPSPTPPYPSPSPTPSSVFPTPVSLHPDPLTASLSLPFPQTILLTLTSAAPLLLTHWQVRFSAESHTGAWSEVYVLPTQTAVATGGVGLSLVLPSSPPTTTTTTSTSTTASAFSFSTSDSLFYALSLAEQRSGRIVSVTLGNLKANTAYWLQVRGLWIAGSSSLPLLGNTGPALDSSAVTDYVLAAFQIAGSGSSSSPLIPPLSPPSNAAVVSELPFSSLSSPSSLSSFFSPSSPAFTFDTGSGFHISWQVDKLQGLITVAMTAPTLGWLSLGFSRAKTAPDLVDCDMWLAFVAATAPPPTTTTPTTTTTHTTTTTTTTTAASMGVYVVDGETHIPEADVGYGGYSDVSVLGAEIVDGVTTIFVQRALISSDPLDVQFTVESGDIFVSYAYAKSPPIPHEPPSYFQMHSVAGWMQLNVFTGQASTVTPSPNAGVLMVFVWMAYCVLSLLQRTLKLILAKHTAAAAMGMQRRTEKILLINENNNSGSNGSGKPEGGGLKRVEEETEKGAVGWALGNLASSAFSSNHCNAAYQPVKPTAAPPSFASAFPFPNPRDLFAPPRVNSHTKPQLPPQSKQNKHNDNSDNNRNTPSSQQTHRHGAVRNGSSQLPQSIAAVAGPLAKTTVHQAFSSSFSSSSFGAAVNDGRQPLADPAPALASAIVVRYGEDRGGGGERGRDVCRDWQCTVCSYNNPVLHLMCSMCRTIQPEETKEDSRRLFFSHRSHAFLQRSSSTAHASSSPSSISSFSSSSSVTAAPRLKPSKPHHPQLGSICLDINVDTSRAVVDDFEEEEEEKEEGKRRGGREQQKNGWDGRVNIQFPPPPPPLPPSPSAPAVVGRASLLPPSSCSFSSACASPGSPSSPVAASGMYLQGSATKQRVPVLKKAGSSVCNLNPRQGPTQNIVVRFVYTTLHSRIPYSSLQVRHFLAVSLYVSLNFLCIYVGRQTTWRKELGTQSGYLIAANTLLSIMCAMRNNLFLFLSGFSLDQLRRCHRLLGPFILLLSSLHLLLYVNTSAPLAYLFLEDTPTNQGGAERPRLVFYGCMAFCSLLLLCISSIERVRRAHFNFFKWMHMLFVPFLVFSLLHVPGTRVYMYMALFAYLLDKLSRLIFSPLPLRSHRLELLPGGMLLVEFSLRQALFARLAALLCCKRTKTAKTTPSSSSSSSSSSSFPGVYEGEVHRDNCVLQTGSGSNGYVFVNFPQISLFEWHPYSLSSGANEQFASIHIEVVGDHTRTLAEKIRHVTLEHQLQASQSGSKHLASKSGKKDQLWMRVEGPYGGLHMKFDSYETLYLVGGGSGVTPLIRLIKDVFVYSQEGGAAVLAVAKTEGFIQQHQKRGGGGGGGGGKLRQYLEQGGEGGRDGGEQDELLHASNRDMRRWLHQLYARQAVSGNHVQDVHLVWIVRSEFHLSWFAEVLTAITLLSKFGFQPSSAPGSSALGLGQLDLLHMLPTLSQRVTFVSSSSSSSAASNDVRVPLLHLHLFVTKPAAQPHPSPDLPLPFTEGRPNLRQFLTQLAASHSTRTGSTRTKQKAQVDGGSSSILCQDVEGQPRLPSNNNDESDDASERNSQQENNKHHHQKRRRSCESRRSAVVVCGNRGLQKSVHHWSIQHRKEGGQIDFYSESYQF